VNKARQLLTVFAVSVRYQMQQGVAGVQPMVCRLHTRHACMLECAHTFSVYAVLECAYWWIMQGV
jgi:hypothetical protein